MFPSEANCEFGEQLSTKLRKLSYRNTRRAAHRRGSAPGIGHGVDDHFMIGVSFARAVNPITEANSIGMSGAKEGPSRTLETKTRVRG